MNTMTITRKSSDDGLSEDIKRDAANGPVITPDYVVLRREDVPRLADEMDECGRQAAAEAAERTENPQEEPSLEEMQRLLQISNDIPLKNIQIIDGARNATFSVFQATTEEFAAIFPAEGQDLQLIEDFVECVGEEQAGRILQPIWERPILKRDAKAVHGTLYYEYADRRQYLPTTKREVDWDDRHINFAQRRLFASKR